MCCCGSLYDALCWWARYQVITFSMIRSNRCNNIVELSLLDMVKLLFGREIAIEYPMTTRPNSALTTLRCTKAYQVFNKSTSKP